MERCIVLLLLFIVGLCWCECEKGFYGINCTECVRDATVIPGESWIYLCCPVRAPTYRYRQVTVPFNRKYELFGLCTEPGTRTLDCACNSQRQRSEEDTPHRRQRSEEGIVTASHQQRSEEGIVTASHQQRSEEDIITAEEIGVLLNDLVETIVERRTADAANSVASTCTSTTGIVLLIVVSSIVGLIIISAIVYVIWSFNTPMSLRHRRTRK